MLPEDDPVRSKYVLDIFNYMNFNKNFSTKIWIVSKIVAL
jgi:hypothetical protein